MVEGGPISSLNTMQSLPPACFFGPACFLPQQQQQQVLHQQGPTIHEAVQVSVARARAREREKSHLMLEKLKKERKKILFELATQAYLGGACKAPEPLVDFLARALILRCQRHRCSHASQQPREEPAALLLHLATSPGAAGRFGRWRHRRQLRQSEKEERKKEKKERGGGQGREAPLPQPPPLPPLPAVAAALEAVLSLLESRFDDGQPLLALRDDEFSSLRGDGSAASCGAEAAAADAAADANAAAALAAEERDLEAAFASWSDALLFPSSLEEGNGEGKEQAPPPLLT